jgi:hypothetical protein
VPIGDGRRSAPYAVEEVGMRFVQFGPGGSEVYLFEHARGYVTCWSCRLVGHEGGSYDTTDLTAMLAHLIDHRAAGHRIPEWLAEDLREHWPAYLLVGTTPE